MSVASDAGSGESNTKVGSVSAAMISGQRRHQKDTGSPEVQIALLTKRLETMSEHFKRHAQDRHSQRGMMLLISRRKRLLSYLKESNPERYKTTIAALGLRK
jgi:small subunit ribosomal protein S15